MCVGSPTAGTWSSFQWRPDNEFETDRYYVNFSYRPEERYLDEAAALVAKAIEQDAEGFLGIFLRGLVAAKRGDLEAAVRDMRRAHDLKPGDAMVPRELSRHLWSAGQEQTEFARVVFHELVRVDPLTPLNWALVAWQHYSAGRSREAERAARRVFELSDPGNPARTYGAYSLAVPGHNRHGAIAALDEVSAALPGTPYGSISGFLSRALQGDARGAGAQVTPQLEQAAFWTEFLAFFLAQGYALIGRRDEALRWLRAAIARGLINYPLLAKEDPFLESLRGDPEFDALMRDVRRRWEAFQL